MFYQSHLCRAPAGLMACFCLLFTNQLRTLHNIAFLSVISAITIFLVLGMCIAATCSCSVLFVLLRKRRECKRVYERDIPAPKGERRPSLDGVAPASESSDVDLDTDARPRTPGFWPPLGVLGCVVVLWAGQVALCDAGFNRDCQLTAASSRATLQNLEILILYTVLLIAISGVSDVRVRYFGLRRRWYFWLCLVLVGPLLSLVAQLKTDSKLFRNAPLLSVFFDAPLLDNGPLMMLVLLGTVTLISWHFWYGFCYQRAEFVEYTVLATHQPSEKRGSGWL